MPVKHEHSEYKDMKTAWDRCNMVAKGHSAVQAAGTTLLPKLGEQTPEEYDAYKKRSTFYNATWRTIDGLRGMIFRKPTIVEVPESVKPMLDDIDMSGTSLHVMSLTAVTEALKLGRCGLFLDYPEVDVGRVTRADAKARNLRPMIKLYDAKSIINWKTRTVNSKTQLSMVVLTETVKKAVDEFQDDDVTQYRVLDLIDIPTDDGRAVQTVYRVRVIQYVLNAEGKEEERTVSGPFFPEMNSKKLDFIPFQFIGIDDTSWKVVEPPLIDLVEVNISHYRVTADYEHGCHFTGLPTPVISGYTPDKEGESFTIGSMCAWVFPNPSAKASYLEFTGAGLSVLRENLEDKKTMMAVLGARMLESEPSSAQSANTASIHRGGEQSMLASIAQTVSIAITRLLKVFCEFADAKTDEVKFQLNTDFFPIAMDSLTMTAIVAAWQNEAIDYEIMIDNLKRGEIVPVGRSPKSIAAAIKANPPPTQDIPTTPGDRAGNGPNKGKAKGVSTKGGKAPTQKQLQHT